MSSKKAAATTAAALIKLTVPAGQASAAPPIGPALGQKGVKAIDFCKQFNEQTKQYLPGTPLPTLIHVKADRTFTFSARPPTASYLLKRAAGLETASTSQWVAQLTPQHLYEIAKIKHRDPVLANLSLQSVFSMISSCAHSIGIEIVKPNSIAHE